MIPHWVDAPDWAEWLAQDEDGDWNWFEYCPEIVHGPILFWSISENGGRWEWARKSPLIANWKETAYKRPEQTK